MELRRTRKYKRKLCGVSQSPGSIFSELFRLRERVSRTGGNGSNGMFSQRGVRLLSRVRTSQFPALFNGGCHSSPVPYKHQPIPPRSHWNSQSFRKMANYPLLGPTPIPIGDDTLHPHGTACFTCTPPYGHPREWEPRPATPGRKRTLVLCFDGTGDSFDQDVSNSELGSCSILIAGVYRIQTSCNSWQC